MDGLNLLAEVAFKHSVVNDPEWKKMRKSFVRKRACCGKRSSKRNRLTRSTWKEKGFYYKLHEDQDLGNKDDIVVISDTVRKLFP